LLPKDTDNVLKDVQLYLVEADKGQKASEVSATKKKKSLIAAARRNIE
jgi:hypothetical protein